MLVRTVTGRQMRQDLARIFREASRDDPVITYVADTRGRTPCIQAAMVPARGLYEYKSWKNGPDHRVWTLLEFRGRFMEARDLAQNQIPVFVTRYAHPPSVVLVSATGPYPRDLAPPLFLQTEDEEAVV